MNSEQPKSPGLSVLLILDWWDWEYWEEIFGFFSQSPKNILCWCQISALYPHVVEHGENLGKSSKDGIILTHGDTNKHSHTLAGLRFGFPKSSSSNSSYLVIFWGVCSLNQELQESSSSWVQLGENSERIFIYSLCPELCSNYDKTNLFRVLPIAMETHMENSSPRPLSMRNPGVQPSLTDFLLQILGEKS